MSSQRNCSKRNCRCRKVNSNCAKLSECCCPPTVTQLDNWVKADVDPDCAFELKEDVSPTTKRYIYDSSIVTDPNYSVFDIPQQDQLTVYPPDYFVRNTNVTFPCGNGIPGPFSYELPFDQWGGDLAVEDINGNIGVKGIGQSYYTNILAHFGHTHILTVHAKINIKMRDFCSPTLSQDLVTEQLLNGSTQIFNWYAQLVSYPSGCPIPYPDPTDPMSPPYASIKALIDTYINGTGTPIDPLTGEPSGVMDVNGLIARLKGFASQIYTGSPLGYPLGVPSYITDAIDGPYYGIEQALNTILRRDCGNVAHEVPFLSWFQLMKIHQEMVYDIYELFRVVFNTCKTDPTYDCKLKAANDMYRMLLDSGRQMGAFFAGFYSITSILDKILNDIVANVQSGPGAIPYPWPFPLPNHIVIPNSTFPAISDKDVVVYKKTAPLVPVNSTIRVERVKFIQESQYRWWYEHVNMFADYDKAAALNDQDSMYKIQVNMLESCTFIACTVGEVFRAFDTLARNRGLYYYFGDTYL